MSAIQDLGAYLESITSNTYVFANSKCNDIVLYTDTPNQGILIGTNKGQNSAIRISSNVVQFSANISTEGVLSAGISDSSNLWPFHRVAVFGPSNSPDGPNIGFFVESNQPLYVQRNNNYGDISQTYDAYYYSNDWYFSSNTVVPYQITKKNSTLAINQIGRITRIFSIFFCPNKFICTKL